MQSKYTKIKKLYQFRFLMRICFFIATIFVYVFNSQYFDIMRDFNFFKSFNVVHVFYVIWCVDIVSQLMPLKGYFSIGSLKHFKEFMKDVNIKEEISHIKNMLSKQISANVGAFKVLILWLCLTVAIGCLKIFGIISHKEIFLISALFYVCDLICVLFFCPFQKWIMKNKCCATCRIFNWDHMMMFSPFIFVVGFYTWSLVVLSLISMLIWEFTYYSHPERFFEETNAGLKCKNCKEKMCRK